MKIEQNIEEKEKKSSESKYDREKTSDAFLYS